MQVSTIMTSSWQIQKKNTYKAALKMQQSTNTLDFHSTQSVYISGPWTHSLTFPASSNPELDQSTVRVR